MADFAEFGGDGFGAPALKPEAAGQPSHGVTFDEFGGDGSGNTPGEPQHSMLGALAGHAAESLLPSAGGLAGAETLGAAGAAVGGLPGAIIGGLVGGFGGGYAVSKAQDYALTKLPDEMQGKIQNFLTETEQEYPKTSWLGGVAPYALTMSPRALEAALPADATNFQKLMASKGAQRIFSGALMGGTELGQEYASGETPDWGKVAASTGMGLIFTRPNRIGETITKPAQAFGARLGERLTGTARPPTVAEAGDKKVIGPGVNEEVFQGEEKQSPQAEMAAQQAARQENAVTEPPPPPNVVDIARRAEPEVFADYEGLEHRRDVWRSLADADEPALAEAADRHLTDTEAKLDEIAPQVSGAIARAAESKGAETVPPPAEVAHLPEVASPEMKQAISDDVAQQLIAAGRSPDEARASGDMIAARYATRASLLNGAAGTAQELYGREGAVIRGADGVPLKVTPGSTAPAAPA